MRALARLYMLVLLLVGGCDRSARAVLDVTPDAGCTAMPAACPDEMRCEVTTIGAERVCGGAACCQSFCAVNGCARCCAGALPR